jgi:hypothetical protein
MTSVPTGAGWHQARSSLAPLAFVWASACYVYQPVPPTAPEPGADIRAEIDEQASAQLVPVLGPGVTRINGLVLERDMGVMSVLVSSYFSTRAGDLLSANEPVRIGLGNFRSLEQKQFSRGRSILLGAAFVGGAFLVMEVTGLNRRLFETDEDPPPGPTDYRVPSRWTGLRVRFP